MKETKNEWKEGVRKKVREHESMSVHVAHKKKKPQQTNLHKHHINITTLEHTPMIYFLIFHFFNSHFFTKNTLY
jgi:hypothetical protein